MLNKDIKKELKRLKRDFEKQASKYSDLTLTIYFLIKDQPYDATEFKRPNLTIPLWQYMGSLNSICDEENEKLNFEHTQFGLTNAEITAFGVVEGQKLELFKSMATRAGSLIESTINHYLLAKILENKFVTPSLSSKPTFAGNSDPIAVWLNFMLVIISTFQPNRFQTKTLAVDPFTASLSVFDYFLDNIGKSSTKTKNNNKLNSTSLLTKQFKVALTFPGEKRNFVSKVAQGLEGRLENIFYDKFYEAELAQPDADLLVQKIYLINSELIVVFISEEYKNKEWCILEWRAVRELIKKQENNKIMLMRFDNVELPGLFSFDRQSISFTLSSVLNQGFFNSCQVCAPRSVALRRRISVICMSFFSHSSVIASLIVSSSSSVSAPSLRSMIQPASPTRSAPSETGNESGL